MPQAARTFRIFVSSTFNDLKAERNALQEHVYPRLKELCERNGARFQAIDLRWGVSEEAANDQQTINICLTEVDRCRNTSPRPNFIVLLGGRYGWRPPPPQIEATEFEAVHAKVSPHQQARLDEWYRRDDNAVPPEYRLRERETKDERGFDNWDRIERELTEALRAGVAALGPWWSPPLRIEDDDFEKLREHVSGEQRALLDECYVREDDNYDLRDGWEPVEDELTEALRTGAAAAEVPDPRELKYFGSATELEIERGAMRVDDASEHVFCFFREIDNLEQLKNDVPEEQPEREPPDITLAEDFVDLRHPKTNRKVDAEASRKQDELKQRLRTTLPDNIHEYTARWENGAITTDHIGRGDDLPGDLDGWLALRDAADPPPNLCVELWLRLSGVILEEIRRLEQEDELEREIDAHEGFGRDRAQFFVPRFFTNGENALERIARYVGRDAREPLAVAGVSGSGKSALMAEAAKEADEAHRGAVIVRRFIGATPKSADGRSLLESLCQEISRRYGQAESAPADYRELVEELPKRLAFSTDERPLIVFLDALDQLSDADGARSLIWLPTELPPNSRVVVSALRADPASDAPPPKGSECVTTLEVKLPDSIVELRPMTRDEGEELLDLWLEDAGRALRDRDGHQREEVLSKFAAAEEPREDSERGLPLYLKLAFEEARRWHSDTDPEEATLTPGIPGIVRNNLFARLAREENHGEVMVSHSLGYLAAAKNGLSEDELLDVLSAQELVLRDFKHRNPRSPDVTRQDEAGERRGQLPVIVWSRLYFDLEPYLGERSADGAFLMSFYHRQLGQVVGEDYLVEDEQRLAALVAEEVAGGEQRLTEAERRSLHDGRLRHQELSRYFDVQPLRYGEDGAPTPNLRKMAELPYQQAYGDMWDELVGTLTDFEFLERKAADYAVVEAGETKTYTGVFSLQEDYALALERMRDGDGARGGRRRIIVTGTDFGDGYVLRCPHCTSVHEFQEEWKGQEQLTCPDETCNGPLKVNDFVVPPEREGR